MEAGVDGDEAKKAAHHESRSGDEHQGEGDLGDDEHAADFGSRGHRARGFVKIGAHISLERLERRREAEDERGEDGRGREKQKHWQVEVDFVEARNPETFRERRLEQMQRDGAKSAAEKTAA